MYYFYNKLDSTDNIRVIPFLITDDPTRKQLENSDFCISEITFEDREGYRKIIYINFIDKKIEVQYIEDKIFILEKENINNMKYTLDLDFRVMEIEFILESSISNKMIFGVDGNMRTQYEMMKIIILSGDFDEGDMIYKINTYHDKFKKITTEQRDELLSLIEAGKIVDKE